MTRPAEPQTIQICSFDTRYQADIDALTVDIQREFSERFTTPGSKSIAELISEQGDSFWVALHNNKVIGTVGLSGFDRPTAILKRLFLIKQFRGSEHSVAQRLLNTAIREAKARNVDRIYLGTMAQFKGAQKFYSKNNFVQVAKADLPHGMKLSDLDEVFYLLEIN